MKNSNSIWVCIVWISTFMKMLYFHSKSMPPFFILFLPLYLYIYVCIHKYIYAFKTASRISFNVLKNFLKEGRLIVKFFLSLSLDLRTIYPMNKIKHLSPQHYEQQIH